MSGPKARIAVAPNKFAKGLDGTGRVARAAYRVMDLVEALERVYTTDAHLVTYVVPGAVSQPRVNKTGLHEAPAMPVVEALFCDVDNESHAPWSDELRSRADAQWATLPVLRTAGVYLTASGRRFIQPVAAPIPVADVELYVRRWFRDLEEAGLAVDWACRDWTRHFRLPNVIRGGRPFRTPFIDLSRMTAVAFEPLRPSPLEASRSLRVPTVRPRPVAVDWTTELPAPWEPKVVAIAGAVREVGTEWHSLFLQLAGALLTRGLPPVHVPAFCRAVSVATGADTRTEDRELSARTTVARCQAELPFVGYGELRRCHPTVADAVDEVFASAATTRLNAYQGAGAEETSPSSLSEAVAALQDALRNAPDGVTLVSAECGLGKTQAAVAVAAERAAKQHAAGSDGTRAPLQSKTSVTVDKNALAIQVAAALRSRGTPVKRLFGPLSVLREDGTPECRFHDYAEPLVAGGQSVQRDFCKRRGEEKCPYYDECRARDGVEGPKDARVAVGPHSLLGALDREAGTTGLLVIDEPPSLIETTTVALEDLEACLGALHGFEARYALAMKPALSALRAWIRDDAACDKVVTPSEAVAAGVAAIDGGDVAFARAATGVRLVGDPALDALAFARVAHEPDATNEAPPVRRAELSIARKSLSWARELGGASRVLFAVHRALCTEAPVAARVTVQGKSRALTLTAVREGLAGALKRDGAVVVLDANADLHVPVMEKVLGYAPRHIRFSAPDGAPIARTLLWTPTATRKRWSPGGKFTAHPGFLKAVREALAWAAEDPLTTRIGVVTTLTLELALRASYAPDDPTWDEKWKEAGQDAASISTARRALAPIFAAFAGAVEFGHYGAMRGLDYMANVDALITLGDPWPNVGDVQNDMAFLGLESAWEARMEAVCRAELEQAHGRLRVVHRSRPGRALHVGCVLPGGSGWARPDVDVRRRPGGRPRNAVTVGGCRVVEAIAALGGIRPSARLLGVHPSTVERYARGERAAPPAVASALGWAYAALQAEA